MTPTELETQARSKYNSVNDTFYTSDELYGYADEACRQLAYECEAIEGKHTDSTVSGTQAYDFPDEAIAVRRLTYNGYRLKPITMREDDAITLDNEATTATGTPQFYYQWNRQVYLRPVPDSVGTLQFYTHDVQDPIESTSTLTVPEIFHSEIVNFMLAEMAYKDENESIGDKYLARWEAAKVRIKAHLRKRKRADGFASVQDESAVDSPWMGWRGTV